MKTASPGLIAFLGANSSFVMADLYTIHTISGVTRYTNHQTNLTIDGNIYHATERDGVPLIERTGIRSMRGTEVDSMTITVTAGISQTIEGLPFIVAALGHALDDATVEVSKAFYKDWGQPLEGVTHLFSGRVGPIDGSRSQVKIQILSDLELLNIKLPRNLYQSPCLYTVYGPGCGVQRSGFEVSSAVASGSSTSLINSALSQPAGWFEQGVMVFTSGVLEGTRRTIKTYSAGSFGFAFPLAVAPAIGDTFRVSAGCDHTDTSCGPAKFNNKARNRSYPYVPAPETPY